MAGAMGGLGGSRGAASSFAGMNGAGVSGMKRSRSPSENVEEEREGKVALGLRLGLSSNGVDPASMQMGRSSSVSNTVFSVVSAGNGGDHRARGVHALLVTTCSAPLDARGWLRPGGSVSAGGLVSEKLRMGGGLHGLEKWRSLKGAIESRGLQTDLARGAATQTTTTLGSSSHHPVLIEDTVKEEHTDTVVDTAAASNIPMTNAGFNKPYVCTRALGPNHKKVRGFLYKYDKVEDVQIVCVCHGWLQSPAEFVKHGGGSDDDIAYPLKRIIVSQPLSFFLNYVFL